MNTRLYTNRTWQRADCLLFAGNGYIGGRVSLDGHGAEGKSGAASLAGFFVGEGEEAANAPHPINAPLQIDGAPVRPLWRGEFQQSLDLDAGIIYTVYTDSEERIRVAASVFFSRARRHIAAYRIEITARREVEIEIAPQLNAAPCKPAPRVQRESDNSWTLDWNDAERKVAQVISVRGSHRGKALENETLGRHISARLRGGETLRLEVIVATADGSAPTQTARRELAEAEALGFEGLEREHRAAMAELWQFDVRCDDPFIERRARSALSYLLSGYRENVAWGGSATGLSGANGWGGCVFWDTEFYMFPALLAGFPELAKNTLLYRHQTREGAAQNARENGEAGLRFAWESRRSGREMAGAFGAQVHIGSDIAFCADWYARSSGDSEFWNSCGREMLVGVARFWASRARLDLSRGKWVIENVIPPDEHVADHYRGGVVHNSVMTNAYAAWVLGRASEESPEDSDAAKWRDIAANIALPRDEKRGLWLEYDGYDDHPIKQADVGHLFFPLSPDFVGSDAEDIRRNVGFYADRERETGLGIFHSPFVYGAALSRANDTAGVRHFLDWSWHNVAGAYDMPRELMHTTGPTVTAAGSFLGLLLYGILGVENNSEQLTAHPCVPESVGAISVSGLKHRGASYELRARPDTFSLSRID